MLLLFFIYVYLNTVGMSCLKICCTLNFECSCSIRVD